MACCNGSFLSTVVDIIISVLFLIAASFLERAILSSNFGPGFQISLPELL